MKIYFEDLKQDLQKILIEDELISNDIIDNKKPIGEIKFYDKYYENEV